MNAEHDLSVSIKKWKISGTREFMFQEKAFNQQT
jgi:hypothetical protein